MTKPTHLAIVICGECGKQSSPIALGLVHAIACECGAEIVLGEERPVSTFFCADGEGLDPDPGAH